MADKINHGGFAFPLGILRGDNGVILHAGSDGMSLRQYFAGQALAGLCANPALVDIRNRIGLTSEGISQTLAEASADLADALIAELNQPENERT